MKIKYNRDYKFLSPRKIRKTEILSQYYANVLTERLKPFKTNVFGRMFTKGLQTAKSQSIKTHFEKANKITITTDSLDLKILISNALFFEVKMTLTDLRFFERRTGYEIKEKKMVTFRKFILGYRLDTEYLRLLKLYYDCFFLKPIAR
jgi:hypothetical protein